VHDWHTLANYQGTAPYVAAHASLSEDGKTLGLMLINRHPNAEQEVAVQLSSFAPKPEAVVRLLNGPDFLAHNDDEQAGYRSVPNPPEPKVTLAESRFAGAAAAFTYTLPAHSVTQLELVSQ
jgi:alpha-L-arabinofuranosidase